ncbi:MAG: hypothetical protein J3Q66DRAFT_333704 [Benniella sp.]|nr:MAG: hypothetical protein J3Q66DRAFT_333704 [Benniella sp.]
MDRNLLVLHQTFLASLLILAANRTPHPVPFHCESSYSIILFWRKCFRLCLQAVDLEQPRALAIAPYDTGSSLSRHDMISRDCSTVRRRRDLLESVSLQSST